MKTQTKTVKLCTLGRKILREAHLDSGGHSTPSDIYTPRCEECVNELASRLAIVCKLIPAAKFSDNPPTVEPCIRKFSMWINDLPWITDEQRQMLKPFAPRLLFTLGSPALTRKRAFICADWACRVIAPMALDLRKMDEQAAKLRALAPVTDVATANEAKTVCRAYAAAYAAAAAAAYAANAAAAAAYAAADAATERTEAKTQIFLSALDLLDRLIKAKVKA